MPRRTGQTHALAVSDGAAVCAWIEAFLVAGAGHGLGDPLVLTDDQARLIYRLHERRADGRYRYRRALIGRPKGTGKSTLAAALALSRLAGPVAPKGAEIPIGAASYQQSDIVFETASAMVREGPLRGLLDVQEHQILRLDAPGRIHRVAAVAGTNDGGRPSLVIGDELHEWVDKKERVWLVLTNGLAKEVDAQAVAITTAGDNLETLCGQLYAFGKEGGEADFLFDWTEAGAEHVLTTREGLEAAISEAYGDAIGHTIELDAVMSRHRDLEREGRGYEFERYFLNRWTSSPIRWLPAGAWDACAKPETVVEAGAKVALGFDGSYNQDSTALVGCTLEDEPHVFVVDCWERPDHSPDWVVPRSEVTAAVHAALDRYNVVALVCDPPGWHREIEEWSETYGATCVTFETNRRNVMSAACDRFYGQVVNKSLTHDDDQRLAQHLANAIVKETPQGAIITKDKRGSRRKIDLAIGAVLAVEGARMEPPEKVGPLFAWV